MRIQAIVTELVFEHALRVRMKAETNDAAVDASKSDENTAVPTPDAASQAGADGAGEGAEGSQATADAPTDSAASGSETATASSAAKGKGKAPAEDAAKKPAEPKKPAEDKKGKNLVGKINNLVTSDLSNLEPIGMLLTVARMFFRLVTRTSGSCVGLVFESPLQITLCMVFLYQLLGWRYAHLRVFGGVAD